MLGVHALGGEVALASLAVAVPLLAWLFLRIRPEGAAKPVSEQVIDRVDALLAKDEGGGQQTGVLVLQIDDMSALCNAHGRRLQSEVLAACIGRIKGALRPGDQLFPLEDGSLIVVIAASHRLDLASMTQIAGRLQLVVQQPMVLGSGPVRLTCCIGYCHARQTGLQTGRAMLEAAQTAVDEALLHRPGAIRAYSDALAQARATRDLLRADFAEAIASGQIRAYFQPQISTDSGEVSGMEALARWHHPKRGILGPADFLSALQGTDLIRLLGREMVKQALSALARWTRAGLVVPAVAVNFSPQELGDPELPEQLAWAVDAEGLTPDRLTVEVLESLVAGSGDALIRSNLERLVALGFGIDLDDFGTGNASITTIRHFALRRLKIDRSFVRGVDCLRDQQNLVTAILSLAEQLGLEAIAEGVETRAEHAMLAQLGCAHVQGYVIAKPLPPEEAEAWLRQHRQQLQKAMRLEMRAR